MHLRFKDSIAGAVAREIERGIGIEGVAYKAAWDRRGSDSMKHCEALTVDCALVESLATREVRAADFAVFEAGRGRRPALPRNVVPLKVTP